MFKQFTDLPHQHPGSREVGQGEVDAARGFPEWVADYQRPQARLAPGYLADLPHELPGPGQVGERAGDAGKLEPALNGQHGTGGEHVDPGPALGRMCLTGEDLGWVPLAERHGQ